LLFDEIETMTQKTAGILGYCLFKTECMDLIYTSVSFSTVYVHVVAKTV